MPLSLPFAAPLCDIFLFTSSHTHICWPLSLTLSSFYWLSQRRAGTGGKHEDLIRWAPHFTHQRLVWSSGFPPWVKDCAVEVERRRFFDGSMGKKKRKNMKDLMGRNSRKRRSEREWNKTHSIFTIVMREGKNERGKKINQRGLLGPGPCG